MNFSHFLWHLYLYTLHWFFVAVNTNTIVIRTLESASLTWGDKSTEEQTINKLQDLHILKCVIVYCYTGQYIQCFYQFQGNPFPCKTQTSKLLLSTPSLSIKAKTSKIHKWSQCQSKTPLSGAFRVICITKQWELVSQFWVTKFLGQNKFCLTQKKCGLNKFGQRQSQTPF